MPIIDYGLSNKSDAVNREIVGNLNVWPPEMLDAKLTVKADVYTLGLVISDLWDHEWGSKVSEEDLEVLDELDQYLSNENDTKVRLAHSTFDKFIKTKNDLSDLFQHTDPNTRHANNRKIIVETLTEMLAEDVEKRLTIDEAIVRFDKLEQKNELFKMVDVSWIKEMNQEELNELLAFFNSPSQAQRKLWQKDVIYTYAEGKEIQFKENVLRRPRKEGKPSDDRFEFLKNNQAVLGQDDSAVFCPIEGTLTSKEFKSQESKKSKNKKFRLVKIQQGNFQELKNEAETVKEIDHYSSKEAVEVEIDGKKIGFWVRDYLKGVTLTDIIHKLSIDQKMELTQALVEALKEQVTRKGYIHRNIKPDNIIVDLNKPITVKIIDYALAIKAHDLQGESRLDQKLTQKADVFSMGLVIAELWGYKFPRINNKMEMLYNENCLNSGADFSDLFMHSVGNRKVISETVKKMLSKEVDENLTINERINLTKALVKALKEQVTDEKIIHRDIKPANIMVDLKTSR